jgi:hypothetical protein
MLKLSKQTAIILILVVFLGALSALIYFYFTFNNSSSNTITTPITTDTYDPFGTRYPTDNTLIENTSDISTSSNISSILSEDKLRQISADPVSGFTILDDLKTKRTNIHYILRANGNIYEAYTDSPEQKRLSITTIPKVYESVWLPDGIRLIIRYLKDEQEDVQTFSVKINPATTTLNTFEGGVDGNHLIENIGGLAVNPKGDKIFYLVNNLNGSSGYISKPDGLDKKNIFESPLIEWLVSWPKEEIITLTTKPSYNIPGYMYFLNSNTGNFSRIIGGINGLTTKTNTTATDILYSDSIRGNPRLYLYNIKKTESKILPWNTLPEKCAWSNTSTEIIYCAVPKTFPQGEYPDIWYQGLVNFTDDLWLINTETMAASLIYDMQKEANQNIDVIDLQLDANDSFLFFSNKTDLTLWSLSLK